MLVFGEPHSAVNQACSYRAVGERLNIVYLEVECDRPEDYVDEDDKIKYLLSQVYGCLFASAAAGALVHRDLRLVHRLFT
jgi:hypothetical protein